MTEPNTDQNPPQWTDADVATSTPDQLTAAIEAGHCRDIGMPPPRRSGHWHDHDQPTVSPLAALAARQQAADAVAEKARTAPATLTDADLGLLDHRQISELVGGGQLAHMGVGATRRRS